MIYLDYNASTPVDPRVREAAWPFLETDFGNPSSAHASGRDAARAVVKGREQLALLLDADPSEIVFTSGGTEANNHVIKGVAHAKSNHGRHIIISAIEHPAVTQPCKYLESLGFEVTRVPVDRHGLVDPQSIVEEIRGTTILISVMHANNEVGTVQPITEIAEIAREAEVWFHTDAAQTFGKLPTRVSELGVDFLSIAGHKAYAPKGIGALYIRAGVTIEPLLHGAGHERGRRAGTEPVPNIVALGAAADLALREPAADQLRAMRDRLHERLLAGLGERVVFLGHSDRRLPNTLAVAFRGLPGAQILDECPELAASTGAACHVGEVVRSSTLEAMGVPDDVAMGMVRLSVGRYTTAHEVDRAAEMLVRAVRRLS